MSLLTNKDTEKTKILIIGDSISIGYFPFVQEDLKDRAEVFHNSGNAQHTGIGMKNIDNWLGDNDWDIIQFNWGLWDLCYRHSDRGNKDKIHGEITINIEDYKLKLDLIVKTIRKKSKAKLIFVTTAYVPKNEAGRFEEDAIKYNQVAKQIMANNNVLVNDIYEKSILIHHEFGKATNDVHYLLKGYEELAILISDYLNEKIKFLNKG